jgi:tRNA dimethylallyltransferase
VVAVDVAAELGAEIVSVDSMQIYRGMDVGTATPAPELRARVPHHLIDVLDPSEDVTVAAFQHRARATLADVAARGALPLLVGGSGLYFRAVVDDLRFPPRAPDIRRSLEAELDAEGVDALYERLCDVDPVAAERIDRANARRIVRALEVVRLTGRPFSDNDSWDRYESIFDLAVAGLRLDRDELKRRIEERVGEMLAAGLVDEVRRVESAGLGETARQALGYRQVLERPTASTEELRAAIASATARFARRQESWFNADPRVTWFDASHGSLARSLVEFFRRRLRLP